MFPSFTVGTSIILEKLLVYPLNNSLKLTFFIVPKPLDNSWATNVLSPLSTAPVNNLFTGSQHVREKGPQKII